MTAHRPTPIPAALRKPLLACLVALPLGDPAEDCGFTRSGLAPKP